MATKKRTAEQIIQGAQLREDKEYALRLERIKRCIANADFSNSELAAIEAVVFRAYGRTKLER